MNSSYHLELNQEDYLGGQDKAIRIVLEGVELLCRCSNVGKNCLMLLRGTMNQGRREVSGSCERSTPGPTEVKDKHTEQTLTLATENIRLRQPRTNLSVLD